MRVEHAFAALKGRFQSLRELRLKIRTEDDLHIAVYWVTCCLILHNMIIRFETKRGSESGEGTMGWAMREAEWEDDDDDVYGEEIGGTEGHHFRGELLRMLIEQHRLPF